MIHESLELRDIGTRNGSQIFQLIATMTAQNQTVIQQNSEVLADVKNAISQIHKS